MAEQQTKSRFSSTNTPSNSGSRFSGTSGGKKKVNYNGGYENNKENYFLLMIGFIIAVIPLITKAVIYDPKLADFDWFSQSTSAVDVFLYYKQGAFTFALIVMAACLVCTIGNKYVLKHRSFKESFRMQAIFIPLFLYGILSLLSTVVSQYRGFGFRGIFEQFESVWCLLGYVVLVYFVYMYVRSAKDVRVVINVLAVGALIIGLIGTFQGLKLDLFRSDFGKSLIASADVSADSLSFSFDLGRAYVTLYNPNYVGVYCTLLIPMFTVLTAFAKSVAERVLYLSVTVTLLISMFAAQFKAGIVSLVFVALVILFLLRKQVIKKWFIVLPVILGVVALYVGVDTANDHIFSKSIVEAFKIEKSPQEPLQNIVVGEDSIEVTYNNEKYTVSADTSVAEDGTTTNYNAFHMVKEDGTECEMYLSEAEGKYRIQDENLSAFAFYPNLGINGFTIEIASTTEPGKVTPWNFVKKDTGYVYYNYYGRETYIEKAETALFDGYENLASKRGFIWARTIPLLKKYFILGSGADTFSIVFPQHDYVSSNNNGYGDQLISKPHCWYLQVGVQTGVLSLLALLVFYGMYFVQSIRLYSKKIGDSYLAQVGVAIFVGTIGYMIAGLTNDSSTTVAPVFWGVIGLGIAVNIMVKNQRKQEMADESVSV